MPGHMHSVKNQAQVAHQVKRGASPSTAALQNQHTVAVNFSDDDQPCAQASGAKQEGEESGALLAQIMDSFDVFGKRLRVLEEQKD